MRHLNPAIRLVADHIIEARGEGITGKAPGPNHKALKTPVVTLPSHKGLAASLASAELRSSVEGTLKFCWEDVGDGFINSSIAVMSMSRIAAPTVEAQAGEVIAVLLMSPGAGANEAIRQDAMHGDGGSIAHEGAGRVVARGVEVVAEGVFQLEKQDEVTTL